MGFLGLYDYDNNSIRELFLLQNEGIDIINPINGDRELFINLSGTFNPYNAIKPLFYDISDGRLYLSTIYDVNVNSLTEEGYWIVTFIIIDLVGGKVLFKDSTIINNTSSYSGIAGSGISGIYKLHFLYNRYFVVFYNGYGDITNPIIFLVYDTVEKHVIHEEIVYEYKGYPGIAFSGTLRITSQLVPGGIDPYPPIRFGNNYLFITPNGKVYVFYQNGTLGLINKLNLSSNSIILYMPLNKDNVLLLTGPEASLTGYIDLQVYRYNIIHNTIRRLTSLSLTNITYERLFIQPINSAMFKGFFIRRFVFSTLRNSLSASEMIPDNLALLYVFTNNTSYSLNLTTSHKPMSQLLKLGNHIYGYMYENNTLNIIDPVNLLVGI
jgi:hypothetical protein